MTFTALSLRLSEQQLRDGAKLASYVGAQMLAEEKPPLDLASWGASSPDATSGHDSRHSPLDSDDSPLDGTLDGTRRLALLSASLNKKLVACASTSTLRVHSRPVRRADGSAAAAWRTARRHLQRERQKALGWRLWGGFFESRRAVRLRYTELYKREQRALRRADGDGGDKGGVSTAVRSAPLDSTERDELHLLERDLLAVEDLFVYRSAADLQLRHEREAAAAASVAQDNTWLGWLRRGRGGGGGSPALGGALGEIADEIELSREQRELMRKVEEMTKALQAVSAALDIEVS